MGEQAGRASGPAKAESKIAEGVMTEDGNARKNEPLVLRMGKPDLGREPHSVAQGVGGLRYGLASETVRVCDGIDGYPKMVFDVAL